MNGRIAGVRGVVGTLTLLAAVALGGCAAVADEVPLESEQLHGAEEAAASVEAITARYDAGTQLQTTANLNLRTGASTATSIILVMPSSSSVTTADGNGPTNGFYRVRFGAYTGWAFGTYLRVVAGAPAPTPAPAPGGTSSTPVDAAMARARSGVGFSYWWGHGRWTSGGATSSNAGTCSGSCPSCSHGGQYGADCSGFVAKVWDVPGSNSDLTTDSHPYSTSDFAGGTGGGQWSHISRDATRRGDAMVYRSGSSGHIFLYESGDAWGSFWTYEARGCTTGIVHNLRTAASSYDAIRRSGY